MYCKNCGKETEDGAKFCQFCGTVLDGGKNTVPEGTRITAEAVGKTILTSLSGKNILGIAAAIIFLVVVLCLAGSARKTISLNKYLTVETSGYDGYGYASASIDFEGIEEKYGSRIGIKEYGRKKFGAYIDYMTLEDILDSMVNIKLDQRTGLSNGDVIEYSVSVDKDLSKVIDGKIRFKDGKIKVSDLEEVGTFDAFEELTVSFYGIAPNGEASLKYRGADISRSEFSFDKRTGLSNGDIVTVTINSDSLPYYAETLGKVPAELEKTYCVGGLESYLTKTEEIDKEALTTMQEQASDVFHAYAAQNFSGDDELQSLTYLGTYLLTEKTGSAWNPHNYLYLVYKAQVRDRYSVGEQSYDQVNDVYWYIRYSDLMTDTEGKTIVNTAGYDTPDAEVKFETGISSGWFGTKSWYYRGYGSLEELYAQAVTRYIDSYYHEDTI